MKTSMTALALAAALLTPGAWSLWAAHDISAFAPEGGLALGANYWGSKSATRMWQDWDPDSLAKDLDVLKAHGFTYLRVFPRWDVFQPIWEAHTPYQQTYETYLTPVRIALPVSLVVRGSTMAVSPSRRPERSSLRRTRRP